MAENITLHSRAKVNRSSKANRSRGCISFTSGMRLYKVSQTTRRSRLAWFSAIPTFIQIDKENEPAVQSLCQA